jgi:hypothetical protein
VATRPVSVVVIRIGCLECGNQSDLLGVYPSEAAARAAHPEVRMRAEMSSPSTDMRMTGSGHEWSGDWIEVGFFTD